MSIDEILNGQPGTDYQVVIQANIKLYLRLNFSDELS